MHVRVENDILTDIEFEATHIFVHELSLSVFGVPIVIEFDEGKGSLYGRRRMNEFNIGL